MIFTTVSVSALTFIHTYISQSETKTSFSKNWRCSRFCYDWTTRCCKRNRLIWVCVPTPRLHQEKEYAAEIRPSICQETHRQELRGRVHHFQQFARGHLHGCWEDTFLQQHIQVCSTTYPDLIFYLSHLSVTLTNITLFTISLLMPVFTIEPQTRPSKSLLAKGLTQNHSSFKFVFPNYVIDN